MSVFNDQGADDESLSNQHDQLLYPIQADLPFLTIQQEQLMCFSHGQHLEPSATPIHPQRIDNRSAIEFQNLQICHLHTPQEKTEKKSFSKR